MKVRLIAITKPIVEGCDTAEQLIAYAARVSNPANQDKHDTAPKLLSYCVKHGHWSVFETASMTMEIVTSRAIAAQLLRHRSFTFQEFSQRYATSDTFEPIELRTQDKKNRQGSGNGVGDGDLYWTANEAINKAFASYRLLINCGVSRETARMILPLCTTTTLYMTGNVRSWIHYLQQRTYEGTQKEHREIALAIKEVFNQQFPSISTVLESNT